MNLHAQIMNLTSECPHPFSDVQHVSSWSQGHRDARHAAAEFALKADACIESLRGIMMHFQKGREDGLEWVCEPVHADEIKAAREALAALDGAA